MSWYDEPWFGLKNDNPDRAPGQFLRSPLEQSLPRVMGMGGMKRRFPKKKKFDPLSSLDSIDRKQKIDDIMAASRGADINQATGVRRVPAGTPELKGPKPLHEQKQPESAWMPQSFPGNIGSIASQMNYMKDPQRLQHKNQALETLKVFGSNMANMIRHPIDTLGGVTGLIASGPGADKLRQDLVDHATGSPSNLLGDILSLGAVQGRGAAPRAPAPKRLQGPKMQQAELIPEPQAQIGNRPPPRAIEHQPQLQLENKPLPSRVPEGSPNRFSKKQAKSYGKAPQDWEISRKNMGQWTDKYGSFINNKIRANDMAPRIPATPDLTVGKPKSPEGTPEETLDFFSDEGGLAELEPGAAPPGEPWKKPYTEHPQKSRLDYGYEQGQNIWQQNADAPMGTSLGPPKFSPPIFKPGSVDKNLKHPGDKPHKTPPVTKLRDAFTKDLWQAKPEDIAGGRLGANPPQPPPEPKTTEDLFDEYEDLTRRTIEEDLGPMSPELMQFEVDKKMAEFKERQEANEAKIHPRLKTPFYEKGNKNPNMYPKYPSFDKPWGRDSGFNISKGDRFPYDYNFPGYNKQPKGGGTGPRWAQWNDAWKLPEDFNATR